MNSQPLDWLDEKSSETARAQLEQKAREASRLYMVFEQHPVAKQLLAMWEEACLHKRTATNAPHTQYAADEAVRGFVSGIRRQIELAKQVPEAST